MELTYDNFAEMCLEVSRKLGIVPPDMESREMKKFFEEKFLPICEVNDDISAKYLVDLYICADLHWVSFSQNLVDKFRIICQTFSQISFGLVEQYKDAHDIIGSAVRCTFCFVICDDREQY